MLREMQNAVPNVSLMQGDVQARTMHIGMCTIRILHKDPAARDNRFLVLLNRIIGSRSAGRSSPQFLMAIHQALPGRSWDLSDLAVWDAHALIHIPNLFCHATAFACQNVQCVVSLLAPAQCEHAIAEGRGFESTAMLLLCYSCILE